jgi:predicted ArsR family transcriptional regulator
MATKVTPDQVYQAFLEMAPCSSTELAVKLGVSSSTIKTHLGKLRDAELCYMTKKEFNSGQIKWHLGKGDGRAMRVRSDTGASHGGGQRRKQGTLADVPRATNWGGHL